MVENNDNGIIDNIKRSYKKYDDKSIKKDVKYFLEWITEHKIFSIFLLILIIMGMDKIAKHFSRRL